MYFVLSPSSASCPPTGTFTEAQLIASRNAGVQEGINTVKQHPLDHGLITDAACGVIITEQEKLAKQAGIDQCKTNPASCALFSATDVTVKESIAKQTGIDQCKTNPASCALFSSADVATKETAARAAGKQEGIGAVQAAPNTYSLHTQSELDQRYQQGVQDGGGSVCKQTELDAAEQRGITLVTSNPNAYSLYTQAQRDTAVLESFNSGVTAVVADPEKYGITSGCSQTERDAAKSQGRSEGKSEGIAAAKSSFSFVDNRLQIPLVDIQGVPQQPTCFSVEMSYLPGISADMLFSLTGAVLLPDCQPLPPMPN